MAIKPGPIFEIKECPNPAESMAESFALHGLPKLLQTWNLDKFRPEFEVILRYHPPEKDEQTQNNTGLNGQYVISTRGYDHTKERMSPEKRQVVFFNCVPQLIAYCMHRLSVVNTAWRVPTGRHHIDNTGLDKILD